MLQLFIVYLYYQRNTNTLLINKLNSNIMTISATMTKSEIFSLAHQFAKNAQKAPSSLFFALQSKKYAKKLSAALKYIYKQIKKAISEANAAKFDFELQAYGKATFNATYKQFDYLCSFDNVTIEISSSQFTKRIEMVDASEAIERAIAGQTIRIF